MNYKSMLRVHTSFCDEPYRSALLAELAKKKNAFDSVAIFSLATHDIVGIEHTHANSKKILSLAKDCKKLGLNVGLDMLSTIGHHVEARDKSVDNLDFMTESNGNINRGTLCPTSEKNLQFIAKTYEVYKNSALDFVFIDDDLDYKLNCFCEKCMESFSNFIGENITKERLLELFCSKNEDLRAKYRKKWLEFYSYKLNKIYGLIARQFNGTKIGVGIMTCVLGSNGMDVSKWLQTVQGEFRPMIRVGGGVYNDNSISRCVKKCHTLIRQIVDAKNATTLAELENFPYQALKKSCAYTEFEVINYVAAGCDGIAYNALSYKSDFAESARFIDLANNIRPFAERISNEFGKNLPMGIGYPLYIDMAVDSGNENWRSEIEFNDELFNIGIPYAYSNENICVNLINANVASSLSHEKILSILSKSAFIDGEALDILNKRGYGNLTGFTIENEFFKGVYEQDIDCEFNMPGNFTRDARIDFSINGHSEFEKCGRVFSIISNRQGAKFITKLKNYENNYLGYGSGVYQNEFGGRIAVCGYSAFNWCYNMQRNFQLKAIFQWLSKDNILAYVDTFAKVGIWTRKTKDEKIGIIVTNISLDDVCPLRLKIKTESANCNVSTYCKGKTESYEIQLQAISNGYKMATIKQLQSLEFALIELE